MNENPAPAPPAPSDVNIARSQAELDRWDAALRTSLSECRDICAAAGNICVAAREICHLTGAEAGVSDPRCDRARSSCQRAGLRRDGQCPVCPSPR